MRSEKHFDFLADDIFHQRTRAGLDWLQRSIDVTVNGGSAAYYSRIFKPLKGWQLAYPETTGYIIVTLLEYHTLYPDRGLKKYALACADWICTLQMKNGALPGSVGVTNIPSVFNTGQMLFGLLAAFEATQKKIYLTTLTRATRWLADTLEADGSWQSGAYVPGWVPSYYTRVIWAVLWANRHLQDVVIEKKMRLALGFYQQKIQKNGSVKDWAFTSGKQAFTHTIAYTIRGFLESALLLKDDTLQDQAFQMGEKIMRLRELRGRMAGAYSANWEGDFSFTCVTGNAQLSIILSRMYQVSNDLRYLNTALKIFEDVVDKQVLSGNKNTNGAVPGSAPFHGKYLYFRYPNWAAKFYLDAYRLLYEEVTSVADNAMT